MGGRADCSEGIYQFMKGSSSQERRTFRRFPASSFSASNPPGPILLLRFFFGPAFMSAIDDIVAISLKVMFSFSVLISREGRCAIDLRAPGCVCTALGDCVIAIVNLPQHAMSPYSRLSTFKKILFHVWPLRRNAQRLALEHVAG